MRDIFNRGRVRSTASSLDFSLPMSCIDTIKKHTRSILNILLISTFVTVTGCSANFNSIYRHKPVSDDASLTTIDAKQRAILSSTNKDQVRQFCSEPSPDVFSVVAQALSAGGSFSKSADPASIEAALDLAFSSAEQGSTIPRTQTINMLRELMFRTCERHLNGAYDDLEMSIQAVRDQRLMVSILAIEQITGAVTPKPVSINATGSSSAGAGDVAIVRLDDALKAKEIAEENHKKADEAFSKEQNGANKECDAIAEAVEKKEPLTDAQKTKQPKCDAARTALASAKELLAKKTDHYADLKRLASLSNISASTMAASSAPGGLDRAHSESVTKVAGIVKEIVDFNFNDDTEVMLFCQKALTDEDLLNNLEYVALASLQESCLDYFNNRVGVETQKLAEEIRASKERMAEADQSDFDKLWPKLETLLKNDSNKKTFINTLKDQLITPMKYKADCFASANSKDAYYGCYKALNSNIKLDLLEKFQ